MVAVAPRRRVLAVIAVFGLLTTGCGGEKADDGPPRLSFDGESCTYEGPTDLAAGPVTIDIVNLREEPAEEKWRLAFAANLGRHRGDETVQDMIDYIGAEPSPKHAPPWVSHVQPSLWDQTVLPGQTLTWEGDLEPGTYTMVCAHLDPFGVWFGTGLTVE